MEPILRREVGLDDRAAGDAEQTGAAADQGGVAFHRGRRIHTGPDLLRGAGLDLHRDLNILHGILVEKECPFTVAVKCGQMGTTRGIQNLEALKRLAAAVDRNGTGTGDIAVADDRAVDNDAAPGLHGDLTVGTGGRTRLVRAAAAAGHLGVDAEGAVDGDGRAAEQGQLLEERGCVIGAATLKGRLVGAGGGDGAVAVIGDHQRDAAGDREAGLARGAGHDAVAGYDDLAAAARGADRQVEVVIVVGPHLVLRGVRAAELGLIGVAVGELAGVGVRGAEVRVRGHVVPGDERKGAVLRRRGRQRIVLGNVAEVGVAGAFDRDGIAVRGGEGVAAANGRGLEGDGQAVEGDPRLHGPADGQAEAVAGVGAVREEIAAAVLPAVEAVPLLEGADRDGVVLVVAAGKVIAGAADAVALDAVGAAGHRREGLGDVVVRELRRDRVARRFVQGAGRGRVGGKRHVQGLVYPADEVIVRRGRGDPGERDRIVGRNGRGGCDRRAVDGVAAVFGGYEGRRDVGVLPVRSDGLAVIVLERNAPGVRGGKLGVALVPAREAVAVVLRRAQADGKVLVLLDGLGGARHGGIDARAGDGVAAAGLVGKVDRRVGRTEISRQGRVPGDGGGIGVIGGNLGIAVFPRNKSVVRLGRGGKGGGSAGRRDAAGRHACRTHGGVRRFSRHRKGNVGDAVDRHCTRYDAT